jgi:2-oxoglutarate dehydrogenase E1 component
VINPNSAFEDELYFEFLRDPNSVSPAWREYFQKVDNISVTPIEDRANIYDDIYNNANSNSNNNSQTVVKEVQDDDYRLLENEELEAFSSISAKIAENMQESLQVPTATSIRTMPIKALDENRRIINKYLTSQRRTKISFTQIILWAIVKSLQKFPQLNDAYTTKDGKPFRIKRKSINLGVAVDLIRKDGSRLLLVPNIKSAEKLHFSEYVAKFDDLVSRARNNKITLDELVGTTITLTNPGMIGTSASVPRLMKHQGIIIASGSIDYPVEFQSVRPEVLTTLAVSKVVTMTSTYDHRIIQGAESAEFLAYMHKLLIGEYRFYDQIFASLKIPFEPVRWSVDISVRKYGLDSTRTRVEKGAHVVQMINAYRNKGHLLASINPLGNDSYYYAELDPAYYGFTIWDLDRDFPASSTWEDSSYSLRTVIEKLRETYCGSIGIEFMHIQDQARKNWVKKWFELGHGKVEIDKNIRLGILKKLVEAEQLENFLHKKFIGHKRFSLEGSESVIVLLDKILDDAADSDSENVIIGMAHRGRLNVLVNSIGKDVTKLFNEFDGDIDTNYYHGTGDVKYHLGQTGNHVNTNNKKVTVHLTPNPSHLEIVNPVVLGMARALREENMSTGYDKVLPILIHGDSAFAGQGIVQEILNLENLPGYTTGGTIHIIINNQIGFTTTPENARSTTYATDISKMSQCPILHVNGNDPEAVFQVAQFAYEYRQKYESDVVIDLISYRKYGHNEGDEPSYTQPLLYKKIRQMVAVREMYMNELVKNGLITQEESDELLNSYNNKLETAFDNRKVKSPDSDRIPESKNGHTLSVINTSISLDIIQKITNGITTFPEGFNANPKVKSVLKHRKEMVESSEAKIDWAMGEALAFGSLLLENHNIRLSGEDSRRGTFSQRHAVLIDYIHEGIFVPLNNLDTNQAKINVYDSPLSELAVLGFDYGYSVNAKQNLTLWEAQFGDFFNMAQPIVDQFISCGEVKWKQTSNLVMLLPHGHDGQGAEHSSGRIERFLQLCADENMIIANLTTPSQYFHALRRQLKMKFQTPLIIFTPKSMLRHQEAVSKVSDFTDKTFENIIDDSYANKTSVEKVLICSGKLYYELLEKLKESGKTNIAIIRLEQIYPFDSDLMEKYLKTYSNAKRFVWVQEEPKNQGAWSFVRPLLQDIVGYDKLSYTGRIESASTATGSSKIHQKEQNILLESAINE